MHENVTKTSVPVLRLRKPGRLGTGTTNLFEFEGLFELFESFGILAFKVLEKASALVYFAQKPTSGRVVFFVLAQMRGQIRDFRGQNRNLHLRGTRVVLVRCVLFNDVLLLPFA